MEEKVFLDEGDTKVTASRVIVDTTVYQLSNISSCRIEDDYVRLKDQDQANKAEFYIAFCALAVCFIASLYFGIFGTIGSFLTESGWRYFIDLFLYSSISVGIADAVTKKLDFHKYEEWYGVQTVSAGQEGQIVKSQDYDRIKRIYEAINQAMIERGKS